jgi:hypothetical protein
MERIKMKRYVRVVSSVGMLAALWLGMASPSKADPLVMQLPEGKFNVTGFQWGPGNLLAAGVPPNAPGTTFDSYFQANLSSILGPGGGSIGGIGLNSTYFITVVAKLTEVLTSTAPDGSGGILLKFALAPVQNSPFYEVWFHSGAGATLGDNLAGTGFNSNNPAATNTKILSGVINTLTNSSFDIGSTSTTRLIDNPNDTGGTGPGKIYWNNSGTITALGTGDNQATLQTMTVNSVFLNPTFFPGGQTVTQYNLRPTTGLEYQNVDPSKLFSGFANGVTPSTLTSIAQGSFNTVSPPNTLIEITNKDSFDANTPVPEPSTVVLSLAGVSVFGAARAIRRRRQAKA